MLSTETPEVRNIFYNGYRILQLDGAHGKMYRVYAMNNYLMSTRIFRSLKSARTFIDEVVESGQ